ncbi:hypothetical protein ACFLRX_05140 [Acidobacteriota bacterium]
MLEEKRIVSYKLFILISFILLFSLSIIQAQETVSESIIHSPITDFEHGQEIEFRAKSAANIDGIRLYFRYEGIIEFQVRSFEKEDEKSFLFLFDTSQLPCLEFEYYLEAQKEDRIIRYPGNAPTDIFLVMGESVESLADIPEEFPTVTEEAAKSRFKLPVSITGSIETKLRDEYDNPGVSQTRANGNIRLFTNYYKNDLAVNFDSNFSYTNTPYEGPKNMDLSNMFLSITKGSHTLTAGDININESEYTVSGLGRRGMEYSFNNQKAYFHVFNVNAQQPLGFQGFGFPKSQIGIFGGAVGYKFFNKTIFLKAVYLRGKDDPGLGGNVGFDSFTKARKGSVIAVVEEIMLFQNKLVLNGELARSEYNGDLNDGPDVLADNAWRFGGNVAAGIFSFGGNYRHIGKDFNPIGYQYFTNDKKGYDTNLGLNFGKLTLNGAYAFTRDNVKRDPEEATTNNKNLNSSLMWMISDKIWFNFGYSRIKQNTSFLQGLIPFSQDSLTDQFMGSLSMMLSRAANISLSVTNLDMSSKNNPQMDTLNLTVNMGGSLRAGNFLALMPSFSYSEMTNKFMDETTRTYNTFFNAELNFIQQVLSLSFNGSYTKSEGGPMTNSNTFNIMGNLNLNLQKIIKVGNITLSLGGNYNRMKMVTITDEIFTLMLQTNISF